MSKAEIRYNQKTIPQTAQNHGVVHCHSETPQTNFMALSELSVKVVRPQNLATSDGLTTVQPTTLQDRKRQIKAVTVTPLVIQPLIPIYHVGYGGGRIYGGGTSEEALRRAKEKQKNHRSHQRKNRFDHRQK